MQAEWYGQSAFRLAGKSTTVLIDPFGDTSGFAAHGISFGVQPITGVSADLLLVTPEHADHNGVEAIGGDPALLRSTAGEPDSPVGGVIAVVGARPGSRHRAGTQHDLRLRARRDPDRPLRRLRTGGAAAGTLAVVPKAP